LAQLQTVDSLTANIDDYDSFFDTLSSSLPDPLLRRLYFLQSDTALVSELRAKYSQAEGFLMAKVAALEAQNREIKETVGRRDIEIEIIKRQLREAVNIRMDISVENQRLKNEIEKSIDAGSTQRSQTLPDDISSNNSN